MKATLALTFNGMSPGDAQNLLHRIGRELIDESAISDYAFQIETGHGTVTENCILSNGHVVA